MAGWSKTYFARAGTDFEPPAITYSGEKERAQTWSLKFLAGEF